MLVEHELVLFILNEQFGSCVQQCGKVFISHGILNLEEFISYCKKEQFLSEEDSRNGLGTLLHHKLVSFSLPESDEKQIIDPVKFLTNKPFQLPQCDIKYNIKISRILIRLRFPYFIHFVEMELGKGESVVYETLCTHGPSSLSFLENECISINPNDKNLFHIYFSHLFQSNFIRKLKPIPDKRVISKEKQSVDVWELDIPSMLNKLKYKACVKMICDKIDTTSGSIAQCFIILASASKNGLNPDQQFFSAKQLIDTLQEQFTEISIDETTLMKYLEIMCNDYQVPMISKSLNQSTYAINTSSILRVIRKKYIESIISEMLGPESLRIFRMLQQFKYMEEDQITSLALIDSQEIRQILYKMMEYQFVQIQEVPRGNDYAPVKTFYLWHVDLISVDKSVTKTILNAILKMKQRLLSEKQKNKLLLDKQEQVKLDTNLPPLTSAEIAKLSMLDKVENALQTSIQRLAEIFVVIKFFYKE